MELVVHEISRFLFRDCFLNSYSYLLIIWNIFSLSLSFSVSSGLFIDSIAFRMGIIAAIRSRSMQSQAVGIMITGSHNPSEDNGIKMIDYNGYILDEPWESLCIKLINESDLKLESATHHIIKRLNLHNPGLVFIARDTRDTSERLAKSASDGVRSIDSAVRDFGMLTTPQLHHIVHTHNKGLLEPTELGYFLKFVGSFKELVS